MQVHIRHTRGAIRDQRRWLLVAATGLGLAGTLGGVAPAMDASAADKPIAIDFIVDAYPNAPDFVVIGPVRGGDGLTLINVDELIGAANTAP